ncbi:kinase-like domain-containing protein [Multifurca ochricompacta]|uniref:Kinase-like domain-containing protein n=1 Tax=Multifurca ochricompacta TaxID=376703 RepID=A0AAD4M691_9AGAM|nr:kinase-like domain-containing protein [Multifurca ochricompacta]
MLLSPPSPPTQHLFPPQPSSSQPTASPSSRSPLSVITVSSGSYTSLEDYSYSPTSESSIPHSESSTNSKTSAFFGSPFPTTSPASNSSQSLTYVSKTAAFFSAPFTDFPTPPPNQQFTPRDFPSSSRSLTADFFAGAAFSSYPTSPPSLRSSTSNGSLRTSISHTSSPLHSSTPLPLEQSEEAESTPVPKPQVPLISRLFPSRYSSNRRTSDNVPYSTRGFVDLEPPEDVLVASPPSVEPPRITEPPSVTLAAASSVDAYTTGSSVHPDNEDEPSYELVRRIGQGGFSLVWLARAVRGDGHGALVAVKMITRADEHSDTAMRRASRGERASFLREVEVLHYLTPSHASVPRLHASFTVRTHHVLVLEYVAGGELLDVVNSDEQHAQLGEKLLRRICRELVSAVEWMHTRFVVHRDIKLENILLTANPFVALPTDDQPLVKLTDFGLARKIDPDDPWLSTRCGSESYAAPELLVASHTDEQPLPALSRAPSDAHGTSSTAQPKSRASRVPGTYDGRETDAWALGVVFFALATRALPFDPPLTLDTPPADADAERARRRWVLRVVRGEWFWPNVPVPSATLVTEKVQGEGEMEAEAEAEAEGESEPCGMALAHITAMRNLVARLLVSDPRRRARVQALWDEEWLGASAPPAPS